MNFETTSRQKLNELEQQVSPALMKLSEAEMIRMIGTIEVLQTDLLRLIPLFKGEEPVEAVEHTQTLLKILYDEMNRVLKIKQIQDNLDHLSILNRHSPSVDYAPVHRLLSKIQKGKRCLVWAGADGAE